MIIVKNINGSEKIEKFGEAPPCIVTSENYGTKLYHESFKEAKLKLLNDFGDEINLKYYVRHEGSEIKIRSLPKNSELIIE